MAREGLMDDTGYHDFDECSHWEECSEEAYDKGRDDMAEETYLNLITEIDLLNASDISEVNLYKFACRIKEIAEGLRWQNRSRTMTTMELIEYGIGHNCLSDAYDLGRTDAFNEILNEMRKSPFASDKAMFVKKYIEEQFKEKKENINE